MKKYRAQIYGHKGPQIIEVEVDRETSKCVFFQGVMELKESSGRAYFDTFDGAKKWLVEKAEYEIEKAKQEMAMANFFYKKVKGLMEDI